MRRWIERAPDGQALTPPRSARPPSPAAQETGGPAISPLSCGAGEGGRGGEGLFALRLLVALLPLAFTLAPAPTAARPAPDDGYETVLSFVAEIGGRSSAVAVDGTTVYLGLSDRLVVLDASDPATSRLVGTSPALAGDVRAIALGEGHAFVSLGDPGIQAVDIRDPAAPVPVGDVVGTPGDCRDLALEGGLLYVADGAAGIGVLDVSDPARARAVGALHTPRLSRSVAVRGGWAFVGERNELEYGVWVVDARDPAHPRGVAFADVVGGGDAVAVRGDLVYVAALRPYTVGAQVNTPYVGVVDVSDPEHPKVELQVQAAPLETGAGRTVATGAARGFAPDQTSLVAVVNDIAVDGGRAYVAGGVPQLTGPSQSATPGHPVALYLGVHVFDIAADPRRPTVLETDATPGDALQVAASGGRVFVADGVMGMAGLDCRMRPCDPTDGYDAGVVGLPLGLAAHGDRLYVADGRSGLRIVDVGDPQRPRAIARVATSSWPTDVAVEGDHAFLALAFGYRAAGGQTRAYGGVEAVVVGGPGAPILGGSAGETCHAGSVAVDGARAVAGCWRRGNIYGGTAVGLLTVDVARPRSPREQALLSDVGEVSDVALVGETAYVTGLEPGLWMVDVRDLGRPEAGVRLATGGTPAALAVRDGYAVVACGWAGLVVADVRDPRHPSRVGGLALPGQAVDVAFVGGGGDGSGGGGGSAGAERAVVAAGAGGVRLIDLTDPAAPVEIAHHDTAGSAEVVTTSGDLVFVGLPEGKVIVLRVETRALPTATPRPSETPTATAVPTETATATQTAEDRGNRIFLPLVERVGGGASGLALTPPAYNRPRIAVEGALR